MKSPHKPTERGPNTGSFEVSSTVSRWLQQKPPQVPSNLDPYELLRALNKAFSYSLPFIRATF